MSRQSCEKPLWLEGEKKKGKKRKEKRRVTGKEEKPAIINGRGEGERQRERETGTPCGFGTGMVTGTAWVVTVGNRSGWRLVRYDTVTSIQQECRAQPRLIPPRPR